MEENKRPEYIFDDAVDMIHKETHIPKWLIMNVLDSEDHQLMHIGVMDNDPSIVPETRHYFWRKIKEFVRFK